MKHSALGTGWSHQGAVMERERVCVWVFVSVRFTKGCESLVSSDVLPCECMVCLVSGLKLVVKSFFYLLPAYLQVDESRIRT